MAGGNRSRNLGILCKDFTGFLGLLGWNGPLVSIQGSEEQHSYQEPNSLSYPDAPELGPDGSTISDKLATHYLGCLWDSYSVPPVGWTGLWHGVLGQCCATRKVRMDSGSSSLGVPPGMHLGHVPGILLRLGILLLGPRAWVLTLR